MLCIKKRDERTDGPTNNPEAICPSNFFEVGGITRSLTKLALCIDLKEICFGIANGQISSIFTELSARDTPIFSFPDDNLSK